ncbi:hypothetical protein KC320_g95 [Hortaea werneckii]|nr:hypothetical protein KC320_g95 [Hortaea werneckii]
MAVCEKGCDSTIEMLFARRAAESGGATGCPLAFCLAITYTGRQRCHSGTRSGHAKARFWLTALARNRTVFGPCEILAEDGDYAMMLVEDICCCFDYTALEALDGTVARCRAAGLGGSRKSGVRAGVKTRHGRPPSAREAGMEVPVPHYYCTDSVAGKRGEAVCAVSTLVDDWQFQIGFGSLALHMCTLTSLTAPVAHSAAQTSLPLDCHPPHSPIKAAVRTSLPSSSSNPPITDYQSTRPVLTQASTAASQSVGDLLAYLAILKRCRRVFLLATGSAPTPPEDA